MRTQLFHEIIANWKDWARVFQSIPAFTPLAEEIFRREKLPFSPLSPLTPGTNAVFRSGGYVVKIFFPRESGLDPEPDFQNEGAVCSHLTALGAPTPPLVAQGSIRDKYAFFYLITRYSPGKEAGDWLASASPAQKQSFVQRLRDLLSLLNRPAPGLLPPADLRARGLENPRLAQVLPQLRAELQARAETVDLSCPVLVHGDLTGENLLVQEDGSLTLIDCADACLAPAWYELGPLVVELFRCDPLLLRLWAGEDKSGFVEQVLDSVCIHDFGPDLLREGAKRAGRPPFSCLDEVRAFLWERF